MLFEFEPKTKKAQAKVLGKNEKFYYVFFIATREDCRGKREKAKDTSKLSRLTTLNRIGTGSDSTSSRHSKEDRARNMAGGHDV